MSDFLIDDGKRVMGAGAPAVESRLIYPVTLGQRPVTAEEFEASMRELSRRIDESAQRIAEPRVWIDAERYWSHAMRNAHYDVLDAEDDQALRRARRYRSVARAALLRVRAQVSP